LLRRQSFCLFVCLFAAAAAGSELARRAPPAGHRACGAAERGPRLLPGEASVAVLVPWSHTCPGTGFAPCHICTGTWLACASSAPGLGSPVSHRRRDWAHPCHIRSRTGLTPATSAPGLGSPPPHPRRDWQIPHLLLVVRRAVRADPDGAARTAERESAARASGIRPHLASAVRGVGRKWDRP
jgi:hypothetical protein